MKPLRLHRLGGTAAPAHRAPWRWAGLGALVGMIVVLVVAAPARWLAAGLAWATHDAVTLAEPQGSVWSGSAQLVLTGGEGSRDSTALPGRIQWRLSPRPTGVAAQITADCCTRQTPVALHVTPHWGGARVQVGNGESFWPAALLTGLGTPWNTVRPRGELTLHTRGLVANWQAGRLTLAGQAELMARHVSSRLSTLEPLGSYRVVVNGGDTVTLQLETLEGALQIAASGEWIGSRLRLRGDAQAAPGMEAALANLLNILGRRQGERAIISLG